MCLFRFHGFLATDQVLNSTLWPWHQFCESPVLSHLATARKIPFLLSIPGLPSVDMEHSHCATAALTEGSALWHRQPHTLPHTEPLLGALTSSQLHKTTSGFLLLPNPLKHGHISKQAFVLTPASHSSFTGFLFLLTLLLVYPRAFSNRTGLDRKSVV